MDCKFEQVFPSSTTVINDPVMISEDDLEVLTLAI